MIVEVYQNQSAVDITLDTGIDLTGNQGLFIVYRKPNGVTATWVGVQNGLTGIMYSVTSVDELHLVGDWQVQTKAILADGRVAYGNKNQTRLRVLSRL